MMSPLPLLLMAIGGALSAIHIDLAIQNGHCAIHKGALADSKCVEAVRREVFFIKSDCPGRLCDTTEAGEVKSTEEGKYVTSLKKKFKCSALTQTSFDRSIGDLPECRDMNTPFPPCQIPQDVTSQFLYGGRVSHRFLQIEEKAPTEDYLKWVSLVWSKDNIESRRQRFKQGHMKGLYGKETVDLIRDTILSHMVQQVMVTICCNITFIFNHV